MITFNGMVEILRPIDQVFEFLADFENAPKWQNGVVNSQQVSTGPIRVGTQFKEVVRILGRPLDTVCEITEYEQDRKMAFRSNASQAIQYEGQFEFTPSGEGTRLNLAATMKLNGLWKVVEPIFALEVKEETASELKTIKKVLEAVS